MSKLKTALKEIGNFVTDILCPIISVVLVFAEAFQLPDKVLQFLKNLEYACFNAFATKTDLDK